MACAVIWNRSRAAVPTHTFLQAPAGIELHVQSPQAVVLSACEQVKPVWHGLADEKAFDNS
jgi:hypothetical protein